MLLFLLLLFLELSFLLLAALSVRLPLPPSVLLLFDAWLFCLFSAAVGFVVSAAEAALEPSFSVAVVSVFSFEFTVTASVPPVT